MPKYGIHHIVLEGAISKLRSGTGNAQQLADLLESEPFAASLGSIGPDLFFFTSDYGVIGKLNTLMPTLEFLADIVEKIEEAMEPIEEIEERVESSMDVALDTLGLGVIPEIQERIESLENIFTELKNTAIPAGLLKGISPFETATADSNQPTSDLARLVRNLYENFFIPPLQDNFEEPDWYWFDMLHYRGVGDFAQNLLNLADSEVQKAYALAYLTHIGTDVVGHPYVNQIVGGPFRLGAQRHVTAENFMDAYEAREQRNQSVNQTLSTLLNLSEPELPDEIAQLLTDAAHLTFDDQAHPMLMNDNGFFTADDVKAAYKLLRLAIEFMGGQTDIRPTPPTDTADQDLAEIMTTINALNPPPPPPILVPPIPGFTMESLFDGRTSIADVSNALTAAGQDLSEWFDTWVGYLEEFAQYCLDTAIQLSRLARSLVQHASNTLGRPLLAMLYGIQLALYDMLKMCRHVLALNGLTYPDADMIDDAISQSLITIQDEQLHYVYTNGMADKRNRFPVLRIKGQSHLIEPLYSQECDTTIPAFHAPSETPATPSEFISDEPFDVDALRAYASAANPRAAQMIRESGQRIGNAIDFCAWMIEHAGQNDEAETVFANWNLDGDRGYGAKSWFAILPHNSDITASIKLSIAQAADSVPELTEGMFNEDDGTIPSETITENIFFQRECSGDDGASDYTHAKIKAKTEQYFSTRTQSDFSIANLTVAEKAIPDELINYSHRNVERWAEYLAPRLSISGDSWRKNCYHVNGIFTPADNGFYERYNLEYFFKQNPDDEIDIKLLYNHTDNAIPVIHKTNPLNAHPELEGEVKSVADGFQALQDKIWSYRVMAIMFSDANTLGELHEFAANRPITLSNPDLPSIENATTIAVIALLHDGMRRNAPLGLIGYSQGSQIVTNGILAFCAQGDAERLYLSNKVKLFFIGRMVSNATIPLITRLVLAFQDLTNPGDPVPDAVGQLPPDLEFIHELAHIEININNAVIKSALIEFKNSLEEEQHSLYLYAPRIKTDEPNYQQFF